MNRLAIQRVGFVSALKFGGVLGAFLSVLPSFFGVLVGKTTAQFARTC